jgi:hypothetical protein
LGPGALFGEAELLAAAAASPPINLHTHAVCRVHSAHAATPQVLVYELEYELLRRYLQGHTLLMFQELVGDLLRVRTEHFKLAVGAVGVGWGVVCAFFCVVLFCFVFLLFFALKC